MTNQPLRIRISSLVFWIHRVGTRYWWLRAHLLNIPAKAVISHAQRTNGRRIEKLTNAGDSLHDRFTSIMPKLQTLNHLPEYRKNQVLAGHAALLADYNHLLVFASKITSYRAPGAALLMSMLTHVQTKLISRKRKRDSFLRILSRIDSDTFYWDLFLWLVVPGAYSQELLGDLNEEYQLRNSTEGEAYARAWYRHQTATTFKDILFKTIERLAAIGTLIDLISRWFRK